MQRYRAASFWTSGSLYEEIWAVHKQEESNTLKDMEVQFSPSESEKYGGNYHFFETFPSGEGGASDGLG